MDTQEDHSPLLYDTSKQFITKDRKPVPRFIVAAANRAIVDDKVYMLVGARHWNKTMRMQYSLMCSDIAYSKFEQGFIDQFEQFVDRKEAMFISVTNNREFKIAPDSDELYSENLY